MAIKKLRQASLAAEEEKEAAVHKALDLAAQISVPADVLLKKTTGEAAQAAIELSEDLQQLVASGEILKAPEEKAIGSEAAPSEAAASRGNPDVSNSANIIEVESGSETSIHSQVLIHKSIGEMSQRRVNLCNKLPADHPLQPPIIEPLNIAPADTHTSASTHSNQPSNTQPKTPTKTTEPNVIDQLVSHYSGEMPEVESELQKASEVASDEVASESPQQQSPEPQTTSTKIQIIPAYVESTCTEEVNEPEATEMEIDLTNSFSTSASDDISETNNPNTTYKQPTIITSSHSAHNSSPTR